MLATMINPLRIHKLLPRDNKVIDYRNALADRLP